MCLTYKWTGLALRSHMITAECVGSSFVRCLLSSSLHSDSSAQGGQLRTQSKASSASIIHACLHSHLHSHVPSQPSCVRMGLLECLLSDQHVVDLMQNKWPSVDPRAWRSGPDLAISTKSIQNQCRISGGTQSAISVFFLPARDTCLIMPFRRPPIFAPDCLCLRRKSFVSPPGLIKQSERSFNVFPLVSVKALEGFIRPEKLWIVWRSFVRCDWVPAAWDSPLHKRIATWQSQSHSKWI